MKTIPLTSEVRSKEEHKRLLVETPAAVAGRSDDAACEKFGTIETDLAGKHALEIRRALTGRYQVFRKLNDDLEYWDEHQADFQCCSSHNLGHEPWIIAAALAIRPIAEWEWKIVGAWSWVYRHAALLDIANEDFGVWCASQHPDMSRSFVQTALLRSGRAVPRSGGGEFKAHVAARSNA